MTSRQVRRYEARKGKRDAKLGATLLQGWFDKSPQERLELTVAGGSPVTSYRHKAKSSGRA